MKILEKVLTVVIIIALILKFNLISGGDVLFFCAATILPFVYYPFGFLFFSQIRLRDVFKKSAYKNKTGVPMIFAIVTGMGLATICIGANFKLLNYAGADALLVSGLALVPFVLVAGLIFLFRNNDANSKFALWRIGIIGGIGVILLFTSNLSIVKLQYRNHPAYIEAYSNYLANPGNDELYIQAELERNRIRMTEVEFNKYQESVRNKIN